MFLTPIYRQAAICEDRNMLQGFHYLCASCVLLGARYGGEERERRSEMEIVKEKVESKEI